MLSKLSKMVYQGFFFFFQAEDGIRDYKVTGVQTCALPICPNEMDKTFGGEVVFQKSAGHANSAPSEGFQFFGQLDIDHRSQALTVVLKDLDGKALYTKTLQPQRT